MPAAGLLAPSMQHDCMLNPLLLQTLPSWLLWRSLQGLAPAVVHSLV